MLQIGTFHFRLITSKADLEGAQYTKSSSYWNMEKTTPQIFYWLIETKIRNFIPPTPPVCLVSLQNLLRMRAHVTFLLLLSLYALYPYIYYLSIHYLCFKTKFLFFYIKNQKKEIFDIYPAASNMLQRYRRSL